VNNAILTVFLLFDIAENAILTCMIENIIEIHQYMFALFLGDNKLKRINLLSLFEY